MWGFSVLEAQLPALTPQARHAATWRACEASDDYTVTIVSAAVGVAAEAAVAAHPSDAAAVEAVVAYASHADDDGDGGRCWRTRVRLVAPLPPQRMRLRQTPRLSSSYSCHGSFSVCGYVFPSDRSADKPSDKSADKRPPDFVPVLSVESAVVVMLRLMMPCRRRRSRSVAHYLMPRIVL